MTRKFLTAACAAAALTAIALPAATSADPRPTITYHDCHFTPVEGHAVRVTHVAATHFLGQGRGTGQTGCARAEHIVRHEFLHRESCVVNTGSVCNLGQYGPHHIYYEVSCRHSYNPEEHHYHHCHNQGTGAGIRISWHRKH